MSEREDMISRQQQDRRVRTAQSENQQLQQLQQQQPQLPLQPEKCPRCESSNTKFCYYNNYSLTQPRYFCKTCRRYWTQGGTLRNVPVGGGCRKGKRTKTSSSSSSSSADNPRPLLPPQPKTMTIPPTLMSTNPAGLSPSPALRSFASYYSGGGLLSSLGAIQSLNQQPPPPPLPFNLGGEFGGSSNLSLLQGLDVPSFESTPQTDCFQVGGGGRDKDIEALYPSQESFIQSSTAIHDWPQCFINNNNSNPTDIGARFWSNGGGGGGGSSNSNPAGSSSNPRNWPDMP